jgi:hypothetical protein
MWQDRDDAFTMVAKGIREVVKEITETANKMA